MAIFNGSEGKQITLLEAAALTKKYRDSSSADATKAHYIGRDIIEAILGQEGCVGIRMYRALSADNSAEEQLVLVGVTKDNMDMTNGIIADRCIKCPVVCDVNSDLNS